MNPLDEFTNSPRRWRNDDGSEVVSSSLTKLGPGLVASRPIGAPGEPTFVLISVPQLATMQSSITALAARVTALEEQLASATAANTPNALVRRDSNGDIFTANFRGNVQEPAENTGVKLKTFGGNTVLEVGTNGGNPAKGWYGATLAQKQQRSESSPNLAVDLLYLFDAYGDVTIMP